CQQHNAYPYTF
nr:immunoglobulin light chain junction region [Macaca mulatta]MOW33717.1 immunoglobulin light chain junction region [Macaca mulatta]MOW33898.1 immunoglobulin light chain junction region [Macaca mulatta]MOW34095.1 immunoglobulin light chain junction region [Macaca mulatta]MOW34324.1 immunoglobulin light chain junction region [Macaca mulatta]